MPLRQFTRGGDIRVASTVEEAVRLRFAGWRELPRPPRTGPLQVAVMAHAYPPEHNAGGEWMLHSLLRGNVARGHDCHVYLSRPSSTATKPYGLDGVTVHPYGAGAVDVANVDVLVAHLENVPNAARIAHRHGIPLVHLVHNTHGWTKHLLRTARADLVVYNSAWMAADCGRCASGIVVRPPVLAADYRTRPGDRVTLVNLNADKGGGLFWELAERLPDFEFLGVLGAYGRQLTGNLPNVEVVPHGTPMRDVYARTRVLIVPSVYESWGRVGVEAMCSGIPVIAHPTPGLLESLGRAGVFVDRDDPDAWVAAVRDLHDAAAWRRASRRARARARELDPQPDLDRWCDAIEALATPTTSRSSR